MINQEAPLILDIRDLRANIGDQPIINGVDLQIRAGEIHAIMGRNGSGKSTLSKIIAGHPSYTITSGSIEFQGNDLLAMQPEERSRIGVFLGFQYPVEIPGVSNLEFLRVATNARRKQMNKDELDTFDFEELLQKRLKLVLMDSTFLKRNVNEGFSGGEKKRNEILQMALLEPTISILDETDSGLDIDALRVLASGINQLAQPETATVLITHYQRLLNEIKPDYVHVMSEGKIIQTGDSSLAMKLEKSGYDWINQTKNETIDPK